MGRSRQPTFEEVAVSLVLSTTVRGTWVAVGNTTGGPLDCRSITVLNASGVTLSFGLGILDANEPTGYATPTGATFELPTNSSFVFDGLRTSAGLFVKREDAVASPVTFKAWARN